MQIELYGRTFEVIKKGKQWQTEYRNAIATTGDTRQEAVTKLREYDKDKLLGGCDYFDKARERDRYFKDHQDEFKSLFGFAPPRDFILYACGMGLCLDVLALDVKLRTPNGVSTNDHILKVYGERALEITRNMI